MQTFRKLTITATAAAALLAVCEGEAHAKKKGPLEGEPIVRNKLQLRKFRFQLTPFVAMSLSQPFVHMGYVGAKAGVHFADWIGIRAGFGWGVINLDSKLLKAINDGGLPRGIQPGQPDNSVTNGPVCGDYNGDGGGPDGPTAPCRPTAEIDNPAPLLHDFRAGLTRAQWQSSFDVVFTPFSGKMGLFSALFTEYDVYIFGGLGLVGWRKHTGSSSTAEQLQVDQDVESPTYCENTITGEQDAECLLHPVSADTGVRVGGSFGAGAHVFITDWVAINLEIQDIVTGNNLAGLNATISDIPPQVRNIRAGASGSDRNIFHNVTFQLGAKFYFPFKAKRTK